MVENLLSVRDIYGNTALQLAVTYNAESLPSLTGRFLAQMLNMKNARGDTVLHYAAANKNSLEYLMSMFQESWLAVRNSNGSTVLHIAAFQSPDSLEYLIKTFSGKVKDLLEIKDRDGQTALHLAAQYKSKSLEYLVNVFGDKVFDLKDNNGRTALHVANTDSLQFLVQKFGDRIIEVKNKHGNTVLQYAAAHNPDALKFLIQEFQDKVLKVQNNLGDTALHFAIKNKGSLNLLIGAFREKVLEVKNDANKTILHCVAQYNKDSLLLLIAAFPNKIGSFLNKQDIHGNTVLHYAVAYNKDSLAALIESFPNEVERLLDVQNNYGITALQLAITYHAESLKVLMTERFVHKMLNIQNVYGDTVLHYAAVNTESLKILMNIFQEYGLQIINNDGSTVLHYAAALNKNSLAVLIEMFPNEVKSLLSKKDFHGHTVWHYTINNKDSLALLIASFPNEVESLFNEVYHSIAPNLRQLIDNLLIRFVSSNNVIDSDNNMDIYGAEVGIAIPGITEALSYYYQKQVSLLLKLRLEYAKPGALKSVDVLEASYILQENNADDISAKLSSFILNSEKNTILMPLNIGWKHLVGIAAKKYEGEVVLYYMDSERNPLPESLFAKVRAELESRGYSTEQVIVEVEKQNYSNCGPEVIENLTAFASGKKRTSQEEAVLKHSTLFEEYLLKDSSKGESTSDSSPNDISAHESIIKSMPVLSESATILGNMLFYKISRVSDMKKSIELNIANTNLLVDAKTQAQLIYYYKTGELLPSARSMLERNSAAIQEHYKFFITNETFQVSMPDTLLADGKLEAQVLHYLRTGELFESARSALESGAVRVISQSSTVSEEEVEKTVQLQSLMRTPNRESHNDSGEALDFSEELSTNDSTDGLLYS